MNNQIQSQDQEDQSFAAFASADQEVEIIGGVACPIDPQERLLCDSCQ